MSTQQIDKNHNFFVGDEICVVRFKCNLITLSDMLGTVKYIEGNSEDIASSFTIKHFKYQKGNEREIDTIYNENRNSKDFFEFNRKIKLNGKDEYITLSGRENFLKTEKDKKIIIWEPIFLSEKVEAEIENKEKTDVANFQYFLLVLRYFEEKGYRYNVFISAGELGDNIYMPIDYGDKWSRLRMLLYLYSPEELSKIYIYGKYRNKEEKIEIKWCHVRAEREEDDFSNVGKIFPLVSITLNVYKALVQTKCSQKETAEGNNEDKEYYEWRNNLNQLYQLYISRYIDKYIAYLKGNDSCFCKIVSKLKKIKAIPKQLKEIDEELLDIVQKGKAEVNLNKKENLREQYIKKRDKYKKLQAELTQLTKEEGNLNNEYEKKANKYLKKKEELVKSNWFKSFESDSILEGLIFVSTLTYLEEYSLADAGRTKELTRLHEICVDYAQGIAQLMENIVFHVIKSKGGGCGSFTFRIRNKKEAFYLKEKDKKLNFSNFMELYIADFNYGTFNGLVSKFVENVQNREKSEVVWSDKLTTSSVKLPHLFGENLQGTLMESYFTDGNNIAMHYGLQILNSVVITGEGCLYVASGSPSDKRLDSTNSFFNEYKRSSYFQPDFLWKNGTAYIIYLPIKHEEIVNYGDVIAVSNEKCEQRKTDCIALTVSPKVWETVAATSDQKARDVDTAVGELSKQIKKKKFSYIDISCVTTNHIYAYEVLSKAVFLLLNEEKLKDIALINIPNEYDVIKIFRQFALFYDRKGKSAGMQDKSVYFIDTDGALDLLLYGDRMDSIKENLAYGKIYGGYSGEAMEIINHLCKRVESGSAGK